MEHVNVKFVKDFYYYDGPQYGKIHAGSIISVVDFGDGWGFNKILIPSHYAIPTSESIYEKITRVEVNDTKYTDDYKFLLESIRKNAHKVSAYFRGKSVKFIKSGDKFAFFPRVMNASTIHSCLLDLISAKLNYPIFVRIDGILYPIKNIEIDYLPQNNSANLYLSD